MNKWSEFFLKTDKKGTKWIEKPNPSELKWFFWGFLAGIIFIGCIALAVGI